MSTIRKSILLLCVCLLSLAPVVASLADLQASVASVTDSTVTVSVHNFGVQSEVARVQIVVQLGDGSTQTLTSGKFAVGAGATASISLTAGSSIVGINDDPEPIMAY